jgi:hypothetical protein
MAVSETIGETAALFAIHGRTNRGMSTTPAGTFSIVWHLVDGRWKIATLSGAGSGGVKLVARGGVGGFQFGMSRSEVSRVADCSPYFSVSSTGGIECPNFLFNGQKMNISFLFAADQLKRIQLWFYEGQSALEAKEAVGSVINHLKRVAGGAQIGGLPGVDVTPAVVMDMLKNAVEPGRINQVEISTPAGSQREVWFARIGRHQFGYGVMLFADSR